MPDPISDVSRLGIRIFIDAVGLEYDDAPSAAIAAREFTRRVRIISASPCRAREADMTTTAWPYDSAHHQPPAANPRRPSISLAQVGHLTIATAWLLAIASAAGLVFGWQWLYDPDPATLPLFLGQDAITLVLGLPALVVSARYASRGSARGVLCWMGTLLYVAYSYTFYVVGARFGPLFPVYIAIVSMAIYGTLALLFQLDLDALIHRIHEELNVRVAAAFLIGVSLFFLGLWSALVASRLADGTALDAIARTVIALDGVVLLPLVFFGGVWLWQRRPLGYALGGTLLVKAALTFTTLSMNTGVAALWDQPIDPLQTSAFVIGALGASVLSWFFLRSIDDRVQSPGVKSC